MTYSLYPREYKFDIIYHACLHGIPYYSKQAMQRLKFDINEPFRNDIRNESPENITKKQKQNLGSFKHY